MLGTKEPLLWQLVPALKTQMAAAYPELERASALIVETLRHEEERFRDMLGRGLKLLDDELDKLSGDTLPGEVAFKLYDTYGFPLDLTQDALRERNLAVDTDGFDAATGKQRAEARANWSGSGKKKPKRYGLIYAMSTAPANLSAINRLSPKASSRHCQRR